MSGTALAVGKVVKSHGVRGEVVVEVRTDSPELRFAPGAVLGVSRRGASASELTVAAARPHAGRLLVQFEGVSGRDAADELRGALLTVDSAVVEPSEDPDEFHDSELEGLRAELTTGEEVGVVQEVLHTPAGEVLSLRTPDGREPMVPFVAAMVPEVDLTAGRVVLDPPEGLLDE